MVNGRASRYLFDFLGLGKFRVLAGPVLDLDAFFHHWRARRLHLLGRRREATIASVAASRLTAKPRPALQDSDQRRRYLRDLKEASDERDQGPGA